MKKCLQIFHIVFALNFVTCQRSCTDISQYYADSYGTYGNVRIPQVALQQNLNIEVVLSVAATLPKNNEWKIFLTNKNVYDDLLNQRELVIKFIPLITSPLPTVTGVFLNNNQLCTNHPPKGNFVSTIKLTYTHTLNNIPQIYPTQIQQQTPRNVFSNHPLTPTKYSQPTKLNIARPSERIKVQSNSNFPGNADNNLQNICGIKTSKSTSASFVFGGNKASRGDFPWLAAFYNGQAGFICGGTLVSAKVVVTAAHCVQDKQNREAKSPYDSTFYFGKYKLKDLNEVDYVNSGVDQFFMHPEWNAFDDRYHADICVATLLKAIRFTKTIVPLCMWHQSNTHQDIVGKVGSVAGWGLTESGSISDVPLYVSVPVVDDITCLRSNHVFAQISSASTFCAGDGSGRNPCNGDSGGAFMVKNSKDQRYYFRGIVSSGIRNDGCDTREYVLFTDVAQYTDWIKGFISRSG